MQYLIYIDYYLRQWLWTSVDWILERLSNKQLDITCSKCDKEVLPWELAGHLIEHWEEWRDDK